MKQNDIYLPPKISKNHICEFCDYSTSKLSDFKKHLLTYKHQMKQNEINETKLSPKVTDLFQCACKISFNSRTTLWRHKKKCNFEKNEIKDNKSLTDKELIIMLVKQNTELMDMLKNNNLSQANHNINSLNNNNNKTFNLQFFLNETCKGAMNIMDFVDSIKFQLSDLEKVGKNGFVEGISDIIIKNIAKQVIIDK